LYFLCRKEWKEKYASCGGVGREDACLPFSIVDGLLPNFGRDVARRMLFSP
jgi:hypothetical protein